MILPLPELRRFVEEALARAGALAESRGEGWDVLLPPDLAQRLGGELVRLTLSPDRPGELVTLGSPALDAILGRAAEQGRVARSYVHADIRKTLTLDDILAEARFYNCRPAIASTAVTLHHRGLFTFRIAYLLEDRHEELREACVHLELLREVAPYPTPPAELPADLEEGPLPPLGPAYAAACRAVFREASTRAEELRRQAERLLGRELQRIGSYFDAYEQELRRRLASAADPVRFRRLRGRLEAAVRERAAKTEDARGKYQLSAEARLVALVILTAPAIRARLALAERSSGAPGSLTLFWDGVRRRLELPLCPCCGQELRAVCLCPRCRQAVCRACLKSCRHPAGADGRPNGGHRW